MMENESLRHSNIVADSNVFLCRTDDPRLDPDFVKEIKELRLLRSIKGRREIDSRVPLLSDLQLKIVHNGNRCAFSKKDPCIGPTSDGKIVNKCINTDCPGINDLPSFHGKRPWKGCNPSVTDEYIKAWTMDPNEALLYGDPEKVPRYYLVDMVSEDEMRKFDYDPGNDGIDHPTTPAPVYKAEINRDYKIDPITGRKMVIIGYNRMKYPFEECLGEPIWGYVNESEQEEQATRIRKAPKIEKKKDIQLLDNVEIIKDTSEQDDEDYKNKDKYEKVIAEHIAAEIKLTEVEEKNIYSDETVILLDNPAELAFVSETFLIGGINHSINGNEGIVLTTIGEFNSYSNYKHVMLSSSVIKSGCRKEDVKAWKALAEKNDLIKLCISGREYYEFKFESGSCWTCRGMYGVTHVCISIDDIEEMDKLKDGNYPVVIEEDGDIYWIFLKNGDQLGVMGKRFIQVIDALKEKGEIIASPAQIKGLSLVVKNGSADMLGMGKLKFDEY